MDTNGTVLETPLAMSTFLGVNCTVIMGYHVTVEVCIVHIYSLYSLYLIVYE